MSWTTLSNDEKKAVTNAIGIDGLARFMEYLKFEKVLESIRSWHKNFMETLKSYES